jgi:CheY-like chemotaxis protein/Tfp pilus assembly protein PilZ
MSKKILLVDDSQTFLMYVGLLLKRLGFTVIPAEDGVELLALLKLRNPDLVILDVEMPLMDGLKALKYIKEDMETSHIPVVIVTANSSSSTIKKCRDLGCSDFLSKPIKIDRLHEVLQQSFFSHKGAYRKYLRAPYREMVTVTYGGSPHEFLSETLSEGGIYVREENPPKVDKPVEVSLQLTDESPLLLQGTVIYRKEKYGDFSSTPPGMAIAFTGVSEDKAAKLKAYVEGLLAGDLMAEQKETVIEL